MYFGEQPLSPQDSPGVTVQTDNYLLIQPGRGGIPEEHAAKYYRTKNGHVVVV